MNRRFTMKFKTGPVAGQSYSVGPGEYLFIGSAETCAIRIVNDPTISPVHACIFFDPAGAIRFKDMGSQFGTFRNGKKLEKSITLRPGDRITIGQSATFQSSWWNALQATTLTRFSMIKGPIAEELLDLPWYRKTPAKFGAVAMTLAVAAYMAVPAPDPKNRESTAMTQERPSADRQVSNRDMGIFSGQLSAKLFNQKPKRAARQSIAMTPERKFIWDEIVSISRRFGDPPPSAMDPGFVIEVERHIARFTKGSGHRIMLDRKQIYWPVIESILESKGMPVELGYIVWIESNFQADALSPVGALGPWQFMPETAKEYGLRVGGEWDQRKDWRRSTAAAADYFSELLRMFGTERYLLAVASYNTGQNRVKRFQIAATVNKEKVSDFWQLRNALPRETAEYVPKFMAAVIIGRNPDRWNVSH